MTNDQVLIGDCNDVLRQYPDESIDCIVTDPPYGYSFMGLAWDKALPSPEALKECCRVLKAGAFGFFMCAPRQDVLSRMIIRLEDVGFNVNFSSMYHCYASGFPKASNVGKNIDKRLGAERDKIKKEYSGNAVYRMDGQNTRPWMEEALKVGYHLSDSNVPVTEKAKQFDGSYSGLQLKPAVEIIIVCMKPLSEKTYVDQALTNGKGVTWLGDCKIPYKDESDNARKGNKESSETNTYGWAGTNTIYKSGERDVSGRFPANLLVSDDVLNDGEISGDTNGGFNQIGQVKHGNVYGKYNGLKEATRKRIVDSGSFSRYFDLDGWFSSKLPEQAQKTYPCLIVPKPAKSEKNKYIENKHPTVKPIKLMSYLITMGSREGDLILDPFAGSGTTLEACKLLNRRFVGIDKDVENKPLMEARGQIDIIQTST